MPRAAAASSPPPTVAASHGCVESVSWMTTLADVDVNVMDAFGITPLEDALAHKQAVVVVLLELRGGLRSDHPTLEGKYAERQEMLAEMREKMFDSKARCSKPCSSRCRPILLLSLPPLSVRGLVLQQVLSSHCRSAFPQRTH